MRYSDNNLSYSDNNYHLPSILGTGVLESAERMREEELKFRHDLLDVLGSYSTGNGGVILASGSDGRGRYDRDTAIEHYRAGVRLSYRLEELGLGNLQVVDCAEKADLREDIQDRGIASIFLIGHSTLHSWGATDGSVDWYDAGMMVTDHLKNGIFANLGCGDVRSWNSIPLGRYVVGGSGVLLGKYRIRSTVAEMEELSRYSVLK